MSQNCPHCGYDEDGDAATDKGEFFECVLKMERKNEKYGELGYYGDPMSRRMLYACPSCLKTFIGEYDQ